MIDEPTHDEPEKIIHPTLIIYGDKDELIPNPYLHPGFPDGIFRAAHKK